MLREPGKPVLEGVDAIYHAIGRFVVAFSYFHNNVELMVVHLLSLSETEADRERGWAAVSGLSTRKIVGSLLALCKEMKRNDWSVQDFDVLSCVELEIEPLVEQRNRIAHDVWSFGHPNRPLHDGSLAERVRFVRSQSKEAVVAGEPITVADLNLLIDQSDRLCAVVRHIGAMVLSPSVGSPVDQLEMCNRTSVRIR